MKLPEDVRLFLTRRFHSKHREWLIHDANENQWPLEILLDIPTEQAALRQIDGVRAWVDAWQGWQGVGTLSWCERRWKTLGIQLLPEKLVLRRPHDVAAWIGESTRWERAQSRYQTFTARWSVLAQQLPKYFDVLADYTDADFYRLAEMLNWIVNHPDSNFYPRQLPVSGLDTKWLDGRKGLLTDLVAAIQEDSTNNFNFYHRCGLKAPPFLVRMRILDQKLRALVGGMGDITAPIEDLTAINLPASQVFIVENLQSGLAISDIPGAVVFMSLGYNVDVLAQLTWLTHAKCIYWGDLDTHGFAILHRARSYIPELKSVLMDEDTLHQHKELWVNEKAQHPAEELYLLTESEQQLYQGLKQQRWGQNIRLEQERIDWTTAWSTLQHANLIATT
ncbi:Wadjet anti-phage system protein JetD domain-containing protein [uncultured Tolumonas sp.]|uniref:Wadjet anti-phage system protein JetD domain-containing protein n=1 Tax=uncultured Tolumonas sp. TaxID=263765 RepID=UPI002A0A47F9|nr:Wadjet anti-phage system protein JetD domain-containing protein [uncultured Tolumonas sp.]